jgi:SSS family solute:Na+ symporter
VQKLPVADIAVLLIYLVGVVLFGAWFVRRNRSTEKFMTAGRSLPGWVVGLSIFGTYVSSISFLALPGAACKDNWNGFAFSLSLPVAAWLAVRYFVPFYRAKGEVSAYHHLENRFGPWARTYAVLCYLLTQMGRMGTIMYLLALPLAPLTGWNVKTIILLTGVSVTIYTLLGGIEAVIWTDVVQSIVLIAGTVLCVAWLLFGMPEGPGQIFRIAIEHDKFGLGSFGTILSQPTFWVVLIYGLVMNLQNFGIDQSFVQRYATAKTDREAAKSVWIGALPYVPISAMFFFIGTALFAFYSARPELLPWLVNDAKQADSVFPYYIVKQLPVGLTGLVIAAIFAAAQSTLSSSLNCSATLILCDIYKRYVRPKAGERESMAVLYVTTLAGGIVGTGVALAIIGVESALDAWWKMASIFSGGMLGLFLLGLIARRATNAGAAAGVLIGVLVVIWMATSPAWTGALEPLRSPFHKFLITVIGTLVIFVIGLFVSQFTRRTETESKRPPFTP